MNYNDLRKIVANCVEGNKGDCTGFHINLGKLTEKTKKLGIIPLLYKNSYESKEVTPEDIPLLAEFFREDKLQWFNGKRTFLSLIFVRTEDIDDNLQSYLQDLLQVKDNEVNPDYVPCKIPVVNRDPEVCKNCPQRDIDVNTTIINIISSYPTYTAIVAKWVKEKSISLNIRFRANSILIDSEKEETNQE